MRVKVYYNLHRKLFSVVSLEAHDRYGKVIQYATHLALDDAGFQVRPAGRARVLKEKRKNVHAFVIGTISATQDQAPHNAKIISYNPYLLGTFFVRDTMEPVHAAKKVWLEHNFVLAVDILNP
jgi:hypothetical protein